MDQIVGREGELAALAETVSAAVVGSPRFLVVEGPLGIGKSALLSAAAVIAERAGARVLRAWGSAQERDLAFGVVGQLFELALDGEPQQERRVWLRGPAAAVPMILSLDTGPGGPAGKPDPQAASRAVYWLTANIARRTPLVVVVDDLQWADPDSLRWLLHLSRRLQRLPLAVVGALCPAVPASTSGLVAQLLSGVDRMPLPGLNAGSVARLLAEQPAAEFAAQCLATTGGNPLLLRHLLHTLSGTGTAPHTIEALPRRGSRQLGQAILSRLSQSGADAVGLATSVALLSPTELETAAAAAGLPLAAAVTAAATLTQLGLLTLGEQVTIRHDLVRHAILAALPQQQRDQQHLRAARALYIRCAPAPTVAAHLLQTTTPVGEGWATRTLWSAARTALDQGVPERALPAQRRLLTEPHQPPTRARYLAELAAVQVYEDPAAAIEHLRAALPRLASPHLVARAACRLAGALLDSAAPTEAVTVLTDTAARLAPQDPDLADELDLQRLSIASWMRTSSPQLAEQLDNLLDRVRRRRPPGRLQPLADALRACLLSRDTDHPHQARVLAATALDCIVGREDLSEDQAITGFVNAATALLHMGQHPVLIHHCQGQATHADHRGLRLLAAWTKALQAVAHHAAGQHEQAAASARAALETPVCAHPQRQATILATAILAGCHAEQGQHQQGLALLASARLDRDLPRLWVYDQALLSRGHLRLAASDAAAALTDLLECGRRDQAAPTANPITTRWRPATAIAYAALGNHTEAIALANDQLTHAQATTTPATLAQALTIHGILARHPPSITKAIGILTEPNTDPAHDPLQQALDLLRGHGAALVANQLQRLVEPTNGPPAQPAPTNTRAQPRPAFGAAALTPHERRLIAMAMAGQTNNAIAGRFGVSRRAVEFHFTRIYRKLGITRRPQLHQFATMPVTGRHPLTQERA